MNKTQTLFALALLTLLPPLIASAQKTKEAADYFPLRVGDSWTYRNDGGAGEYTYKVLREDPQPSHASRFLVELTAGVKVEYYYSKADGWVLQHAVRYPEHEGLEVKYDPPRQHLPNPLVAGKTWEWSGKDQSGNDRHEESRVAGFEEVTVVAGKFRAMKVVSKITGAAQLMTKTYWYAEGVGMVKTTTEAGETKYGSELIDYSFKKEPKK
jgi:hypothetical protein